MNRKISLLLCHILFIFASEWIICRSDRPDLRRYLPANNYLNEENSYDRADHEDASFVNRYYSAAYADRTRALDDSYSIDRERKEGAEDRSDLNPSPGSENLRSAYSKSRNTVRNGDTIEVVTDHTAMAGGSTSDDVILNEKNLADVASKLFAGGSIAGGGISGGGFGEIKFQSMPRDVFSHTYSMMKLSPGRCMCESIDGTQSFFSINGSNDINFHFNGIPDGDSNAKINAEFDASKAGMFKNSNAFFNFDGSKSFSTIYSGQKSTQFDTQFGSSFNVDGSAKFDDDYISGILLKLVGDGKLAVNSFSTLSAEQLKELYKRIFINMQIDTQNKIDAQAILQLIAQINAESKAQAQGDANSKVSIQGQFIGQGQTDVDAQAMAQEQARLDAQIQAQLNAQLDAQLQAQAQAQTQANAEGQANTNINANKAMSVSIGGGGGGGGSGGSGFLGFGGLIRGIGGAMGGGIGGGIGGGMGGSIGGAMGGGIGGGIGGGMGGSIGGAMGGAMGGGVGGGMGSGIGGAMGGGIGGGMNGLIGGGMSGLIGGGVSGYGSAAVSGYGGAGKEFYVSSRHPFGYQPRSTTRQ